MARIVLASYLIRFPMGGYQSWILQWLLGFRQLGHDVYFVEKAAWENACFDPNTGQSSDDPSAGIRVVSDLLERFGLARKWCFVERSGRHHGLSRSRVQEVFRSADVFIDNVQHCEWWEEAQACQRRVLVDGEPGYRQIRMEKALASGATDAFPTFDFHFTVGRNVGTSSSSAPTAGRTWHPVFDPVVPELFRTAPPPLDAAWTTVTSWQVHQELEHNGVVYGQKDMEFERFMDLPQRVDAPVELAIAGRRVPRARLESAGWRLRDAHSVTRTLDDWRTYIAGSRGEFSVAKNVFVATNSGFFSDRSAAYLASGRPVVMQDTGFSAHLPCGDGLFAVTNVEEAAEAINRVTADYDHHSRAARAIACEHLDAAKVLPAFLSAIGL